MNRIFILLNTLTYFCFACLIGGCSLGNEELQFSSFSKGWPQHEEVQFSFTPEKIDRPTNLFLYLRNNEDYPFSNIHLITTLESPIGDKLVDTLSYTMAAPNGEWLGQGLLVHESKLWFKEAYRFRVIGEYQLTIKPAMRHNEHAESIDVLQGITEVGLGVERIHTDK
jgi:gliding motility-associated lipoprotein GldH